MVTDLARYARGDGSFSRPHRHLPTNKNAPQDCEAFGAENETRTRDKSLISEHLPLRSLYLRLLLELNLCSREYKQ